MAVLYHHLLLFLREHTRREEKFGLGCYELALGLGSVRGVGDKPSHLLGTLVELALPVLCPGKAISLRQTRTIQRDLYFSMFRGGQRMR